MDTALLDAAFRLVSRSITSIEARFHSLTTDEARLAELRRQFPQTDVQAVQEAYARAQRLEEVAIEMADGARNQRKGQSEPVLDAQALGARCPGFSGESYFWAINDGFTLTRK
jgi:hypothetical protein